MSKRRILTKTAPAWAIRALVVFGFTAPIMACENKEDVEVGMADADVPDVGVITGGTQNLCNSLAQSYEALMSAHRSCTADNDCKYYEKVGMCGTALNEKLPSEHLAHIGALQKAYACQLPSANCPGNQADDARCVAGTCQVVAN